MKIKVCGLTLPEQAYTLDDLGVDYLGFIFYPGSSRYVYAKLDAAQINRIKLKNARKVGVFVNESTSTILETAQICGLDMVQLHGDETPQFCKQIADHLPTIKAIHLTDNAAIAWKISAYIAMVDMLLFDTGGAGYGGTGEKFNWELLKEAHVKAPFFLSGGIGPADAEVVNSFSRNSFSDSLYGVDINSRFEIAPGMKDIKRIETFTEGLRKGITKNEEL